MKGSAIEALVEVKTLNAGERYHNVDDKRCAAVAQRQRQIHNEYSRKAQYIDATFNGVPNGGGPVMSHLRKFGRVRGAVFGSLGEWSEDVEILVRLCTDRIARLTWMTAGFRNEQDGRAIIFKYAMKKLAILSLKSVADLVYARRESIGSNYGGASKDAKDSALKFAAGALLENSSIHQSLRGGSCENYMRGEIELSSFPRKINK